MESWSGRPDLRVLVVEDDMAARSALVALVGTFGVDVRGAGDSEEAYRLVLEGSPDLILCDLEMPAHLGLVRRLRRDPRFGRLLIVAVGEGARPVSVARTREAGFDGHMVRPISAVALARVLDRALDRQMTHREPQGG